MPIYKHECKHCIFLGHDEHNHEPVDVFFCRAEQPTPTVIVRFGNEGWSYYSCDVKSLSKLNTPLGHIMHKHYTDLKNSVSV